MSDLPMTAFTKLDPLYPGYVNLRTDKDGGLTLTVRGDPKTYEASYVCGFASDKGHPGRCTPGDECCNNYCNMAPDKGPMAPKPSPCTQTKCAETVTIRLTAGEADAWFNNAALVARTANGRP